jgi:hypothetical protein
MKIKLLKSWGLANPGDVINPPPGVAQLLIERGIAELYEGEEQGFAGKWNKRIAYPATPAVTRGQRGRK